MPRNVSRRAHVDPVEGAVARDGIGGAGVQIVKVHIRDVLGEEDLIVLVHGNGGILPPEEASGDGRPVAQTHARFQIRNAGAQDHTDGALHAVDWVVLGQPADHAAVGAFLRFKIAGQKAGRPVVIRPVELHAAGDPRAERADQAGLDDVLAVEKVIVGGLVPRGEDPSPDLWEHQNVQIFVFQMHNGIAFFLTETAVDLQNGLVGVRAAGGALMHTVLGEQRHFLLRWLRIGWERQLLDADACF